MIGVDDMRREAGILNQALLEYGFAAYDGVEWMDEDHCFATWHLGSLRVTLRVKLGKNGFAIVKVWCGEDAADEFKSNFPHFADRAIASGLLDDWV